MKVKKLPLIKADTIRPAPPLDEDWYNCTKCFCSTTAYFHTDFYYAERKWPGYWEDERRVVLCTRCAQVEGWTW